MSDEQGSFFKDAYQQQRSPLASKLRPQNLDDVMGQQHLIGPTAPLRNMIMNDHLVSMILWGPAGTGKTSLAEVIARHTKLGFQRLSAVSAGVADMRKVINISEQNILNGQPAIIMFLDEVHALSKNQQDVLLPAVETGDIILIGATTEKPFTEINGPLLSRCHLFRLESLSAVDIRKVIGKGLEALGASIKDDAAAELVQRSSGDARQALSVLEMVYSTKADQSSPITVEDISHAGAVKIYEVSKETYYDEVAAWIQSMNGSDPQAAVYWLARLLAAGVDIKFLARRIMVLAAEDIGLADPQAMLVAAACIQAVQFVGLPECALNLSEATLYMAQAPKSNRSAVAIWQAQKYVEGHPNYPVPSVMQSRENWWHGQTGAGKGYRYPHAEGGYAAGQKYLPDEVHGLRLYEPGKVGFEIEVSQRMLERKRKDDAAKGREAPEPEEAGSAAEPGPLHDTALSDAPAQDLPQDLDHRMRLLLQAVQEGEPDVALARQAVYNMLACDTDIADAALMWAMTGIMPERPVVSGHSPRELSQAGFHPTQVFSTLQLLRLDPQEANRLINEQP